MPQNRKPPAYMEYAATVLSTREYRLMTLAQRGLFHTMRLECWVNHHVPASLDELAKYLGIESSEARATLTDGVKSFFNEENGLYSCPELEDYRQYLAERKAKQSKGGERGAAIKNRKRNTSNRGTNTTDEGNTATNSQVPRRVGDESLVQSSTEKQSQTQSLESDVPIDPWVADYEAGEK
jgi:hypothetical protein